MVTLKHMNKIILAIIASALCISAYAQADFVKKMGNGESQTLVVYGTSVSSLVWGKVWVQKLGEELNARYGNNLTLYNSGKSGQNSRWALAHLQDSVIARNPDAVIIEFATNDAVTRFDISLDECRENTLKLIDTIKESCPECEIILHTVCGYPLGKNAENRPQMEEYNAVYKKIASDRGFIYVDESAIVRNIGRKQGEKVLRKFFGDGVHSTEKGAVEIIFPNVLKALTGDKSIEVNTKGEL